MATTPVTTTNGNIVQFPVSNDAQVTALRNDRSTLTNLGQQISALVQHYNDLKKQLMAEPDKPTQDQFATLLSQRKAAIQALMDSWKSKVDSLTAKAMAIPNGTAVLQENMPTISNIQLSGLGQLVDTSGLTTSITTETTKMTLLDQYYTAYKAAIAAGTTPPALPAELQSGMLGLSSTVIIAGVAAVAGLLLFMGGKK